MSIAHDVLSLLLVVVELVRCGCLWSGLRRPVVLRSGLPIAHVLRSHHGGVVTISEVATVSDAVGVESILLGSGSLVIAVDRGQSSS